MTERFVAFDIDGVLADLLPGMCQSLAAESGREFLPSHWTRYNAFVDVGVEFNRFIELLVRDKVIEQSLPHDGAAACIDLFKQAGYTIAAVTARGYHPNGHELTQAWLEQWGIAVDELYLVGSHDSKHDVLSRLQERGTVLCYVDDHVDHLVDLKLKSPQLPLFLMSQLWNQSDSTFRRVANLEEFSRAAMALHDQQRNAGDTSLDRVVEFEVQAGSPDEKLKVSGIKRRDI